MTNPIVVDVAALRTAVLAILDEVERSAGTTIDLDVDHYWTLDEGAAFTLAGDPAAAITVGQLHDDLESIDALLTRAPDDPVVVWHDLGHVIGVLRLLVALDLPTGSPSER